MYGDVEIEMESRQQEKEIIWVVGVVPDRKTIR